MVKQNVCWRWRNTYSILDTKRHGKRQSWHLGITEIRVVVKRCLDIELNRLHWLKIGYRCWLHKKSNDSLRYHEWRGIRCSADRPSLLHEGSCCNVGVSWRSNMFLSFFFYVLPTVHLRIILETDQLNAQILFYNKFSTFLYMFRAQQCSKHVEEYNKLIIKQEFVH